MLLGLALLLSERSIPSVYIGVNNHAAILAMTATLAHSGHSLTDTFIALVNRVLAKHNLPYLNIHWVPCHTNIAGNKAVDAEAKKAMEGSTSPPTCSPQH